MPLGQTGQEFLPESNIDMCEWNLIGCTLSGPGNKCKIL